MKGVSLKKKLYYTMMLFMLLAGNVFAGSGARIKIDRNYWDFGQVKQGEVKQKNFTIENIGDEDLIISTIFSSCECTTAEISSTKIAPQGKETLKVSYDTKDMAEQKDIKEIYIISNDSYNPETKITITAAIVSAKRKKLETNKAIKVGDVFLKSLYSKLKCCPSCKDDFAICSCPTAKKMKVYIEALLDAGLNEEDILFKIAKKYSLSVIIDKKTHDKIKNKMIKLAGKRRPQISIKPISFNLRKVSKRKGKLVLKAKLQNKGKEILKITGLKVSCTCVTVQLKTKKYISPAFGTKGSNPGWEVSIAPKRKGELIITLDLNHSSIRLGKMTRFIEIESNDPVHSLMKVKLEAEIVE